MRLDSGLECGASVKDPMYPFFQTKQLLILHLPRLAFLFECQRSNVRSIWIDALLFPNLGVHAGLHSKAVRIRSGATRCYGTLAVPFQGVLAVDASDVCQFRDNTAAKNDAKMMQCAKRQTF